MIGNAHVRRLRNGRNTCAVNITAARRLVTVTVNFKADNFSVRLRVNLRDNHQICAVDTPALDVGEETAPSFRFESSKEERA